MTTYHRTYDINSEQKQLLRDLIVYQIGIYDMEIKAGGTCPFIARRAEVVEFLFNLNYKEVVDGDDSTMIMMKDIIKLCNPLSEETKAKHPLCTDAHGVDYILGLYPNETIIGLAEELKADKMDMASTSSWCMR